MALGAGEGEGMSVWGYFASLLYSAISPMRGGKPRGEEQPVMAAKWYPALQKAQEVVTVASEGHSEPGCAFPP